MPEDYAAIEKRIQSALDTLQDEAKPNVARIAREHAVPEKRL